jgi:hypothetical protein
MKYLFYHFSHYGSNGSQRFVISDPKTEAQFEFGGLVSSKGSSINNVTVVVGAGEG